MKKTGILLFSAVCFLYSCNSNAEGSGRIFNLIPKEGKGIIKNKEYKLSFDEISVAQSIKAEVVKASEEKVVVTAPSDILEDVLVEKVGEKLYIHFKPGLNISARNVAVKIFAKDFSKIEASSSADINVRDQFTQNRTTIKVSSSGTIKGDFEANDLDIDVSSSGNYSGKVWAVDLDVEVSSSGDINLSGKAKNTEMDASSSGSINAGDLIAETADLKASSSGSVNLSVSQALSATANSSGDIDVIRKGNLQIISQKENSGGSISVR